MLVGEICEMLSSDKLWLVVLAIFTVETARGLNLYNNIISVNYCNSSSSSSSYTMLSLLS